MAIVANLGIPGFPIDVPLHTPNRIIGINPVGTTVPLYSGEIVVDSTTTKLAYYATSMLNSSWVQFILDSD